MEDVAGVQDDVGLLALGVLDAARQHGLGVGPAVVPPEAVPEVPVGGVPAGRAVGSGAPPRKPAPASGADPAPALSGRSRRRPAASQPTALAPSGRRRRRGGELPWEFPRPRGPEPGPPLQVMFVVGVRRRVPAGRNRLGRILLRVLSSISAKPFRADLLSPAGGNTR